MVKIFSCGILWKWSSYGRNHATWLSWKRKLNWVILSPVILADFDLVLRFGSEIDQGASPQISPGLSGFVSCCRRYYWKFLDGRRVEQMDKRRGCRFEFTAALFNILMQVAANPHLRPPVTMASLQVAASHSRPTNSRHARRRKERYKWL